MELVIVIAVVVVAVTASSLMKGLKLLGHSNRVARQTESWSPSFLRPKTPDLSFLPERYIVVDVETTGLEPYRDEIIEIGAIGVNRDSDVHDSWQVLVKCIG